MESEVISITNKEDCCGCSACAQACPKKCIDMVEDNEGFLYPRIDQSVCINCGICEKTCPIKNQKPEQSFKQTAYVVQNKDLKILRESTSGGAFSALSCWAIKQGGVVFGAAYDDHLTVQHQFVEDERSISKFRNSKYVQSKIGNSFQQVKEFLQKGRIVLFSGTPCQIEGLLSYLRKPFENLWTVDIVCHACPSPLMFRKYKEWQNLKCTDKIENISFRDKYYGYKYSTMSVFRKEKNYHEGIDTDPYLRAFFQHLSIRPSCFKCAFKKIHRPTDFTIWDCFDVENFCKSMDNDRGVTKILCHSARAQSLILNLQNYLSIYEVSPEKIIEGEKELVKAVEPCHNRTQFFKDLNKMPVEECFKKYFPLTPRHRIEKQIRIWTNRLGIYKFAKKIFKIINGNREIKR